MTPPRAPQWEARPAPDSNYEWDIFNPAGVKVAEVLAFGPDRDGLEAEGNAKFLVLAANAYRPLVEALAGLLEWADQTAQVDVPNYKHDPQCDCCRPREQARAAVALTRRER